MKNMRILVSADGGTRSYQSSSIIVDAILTDNKLFWFDHKRYDSIMGAYWLVYKERQSNDVSSAA